MDFIADAECEWGVNALGNVLVSLPRFHADKVDHARLRGEELVFHHDWFRRTAVRVPGSVLGHLSSQPTVLLVAWEGEGQAYEADLPLRHVDASAGQE